MLFTSSLDFLQIRKKKVCMFNSFCLWVLDFKKTDVWIGDGCLWIYQGREGVFLYAYSVSFFAFVTFSMILILVCLNFFLYTFMCYRELLVILLDILVMQRGRLLRRNSAREGQASPQEHLGRCHPRRPPKSTLKLLTLFILSSL